LTFEGDSGIGLGDGDDLSSLEQLLYGLSRLLSTARAAAAVTAATTAATTSATAATATATAFGALRAPATPAGHGLDRRDRVIALSFVERPQTRKVGWLRWDLTRVAARWRNAHDRHKRCASQ
jgi:hypothetical protein